MKNLKRFGLLMLFVLSISHINAQALLKNIKNKAQDKIEQRIEQRANEKIDNEIDKQLDKVEEAIFKDDESNDSNNVSNRKKSSDDRLTSMMKRMGVGGEPVPIAESYSFDQLIQMHIESYDGNGKKISDGDFITLLNKNSKSLAYQAVSGDLTKPGQGMFIVDLDNKAIIMLIDENGSKSGIVYGLGALLDTASYNLNYDDDAVEDTPEFYAAHPNIKKTGRTKNIAGYSCEQYVLSDEYSEGEVWVTRDIKMRTNDFLSTLFKVEMAATGMGWGYLMESTSVQKDTGEKSMMKVTQVDPNASKSFNLKDYQITNMGNINIPVGQ